jgi:hypothetical protein
MRGDACICTVFAWMKMAVYVDADAAVDGCVDVAV